MNIEFTTGWTTLIVANCVSRLRPKSRLYLSINSEMDFIVSHFSRFSTIELDSRRFSELETSINHKILNLYRENASVASIDRFSDAISDTHLDELHWPNICRWSHHRFGAGQGRSLGIE
jgi:hypothetical protein